MARMELDAGWEATVLRAILPQMHDLSSSINHHIDIEGPTPGREKYATGTLKSASYSDVDEATSSILVAVDPSVVNPRTHQRTGEYASFTINGTSRQSANDYLERATAAALQELRVSDPR